ncbi:MAG: carbamoyltransferase HypF [Nitrospiraceae bacterium]|nr:MAG: carbamoyltransferase HypF [Nitrospiraceae bacterium]
MTVLRWLVKVGGIVQGVGFRPFIYNLAGVHDLKGFVANSSEGVEIDVEGSREALEGFLNEIREKAPPLSMIEDISVQEKVLAGYQAFEIRESERSGKAKTLVSADVCICEDCLKEVFDPGDRRYRYPFINCTNCGPRFTIIRDVPYDRDFTTMSTFPMCPECFSEYHDPVDRRFHAQPNACHQCGPSVLLKDASGGVVEKDNPLPAAARLLQAGYLLAVKGLGGYHLACNALDHEAVRILRERKVREDKPFAVMVNDITEAKKYCHVSDLEAELLQSQARPIVLLRKKSGTLAPQVAPENAFLGLMLPYTPLHYLLFEQIEFPLVMTSGNLSDEPIAYEDRDALMRLGDVADYFLTHNREIRHRCDDSVTRVYRGDRYPVRRSRGYAPAPVRLDFDLGRVLAVGAEQKNTFCLTKGNYAFVSHHVGDLENLETLQAFEESIELYKRLFQVEPEIIAYDYHPEYLSTKYAMANDDLPKTGVQHHHAHIAGCMAEHGLTGNVIGAAFDGTGFGIDGAIWGGEFFYGSPVEFKRIAHLKYVPMPGGAKAIREPWRMAAGYLRTCFGKQWRDAAPVTFLAGKNGMLLDTLDDMMEKWINCPPTSSMGRFFDATAALIGIRETVNYEGQAAIELEQRAISALRGGDITYNYVIQNGSQAWEIDTGKVISEILEDCRRKVEQDLMAYKFHNTVKNMLVEVCRKARDQYGENRVCLSGGVFQNILLLDMVYRALEENGFTVFIHRIVPANDGGISLGQALIASERRRLVCV